MQINAISNDQIKKFSKMIRDDRPCWINVWCPAGTVRRPNQSWTILNHNRTVGEPILLIRSATVRLWFLLIGSATVQLWFTHVRTHPFTFWFSRTDPESKMPTGCGLTDQMDFKSFHLPHGLRLVFLFQWADFQSAVSPNVKSLFYFYSDVTIRYSWNLSTSSGTLFRSRQTTRTTDTDAG